MRVNIGTSSRLPPHVDDPVLVIAVMGVTGSGKSNFIRVVSGRDDVEVGDTLRSCKISG